MADDLKIPADIESYETLVRFVTKESHYPIGLSELPDFTLVFLERNKKEQTTNCVSLWRFNFMTKDECNDKSNLPKYGYVLLCAKATRNIQNDNYGLTVICNNPDKNLLHAELRVIQTNKPKELLKPPVLDIEPLDRIHLELIDELDNQIRNQIAGKYYSKDQFDQTDHAALLAHCKSA